MNVAPKPFVYRATVLTIRDGDSITADLDLGFDVTLANQGVRLDGMDAPELKTAEGVAARTFLATLIAPGQRLTIRTKLADSREKFGRILAELWREGDAESLNAKMILAGHAKPYSGGKR